jgi:hypothetical protein
MSPLGSAEGVLRCLRVRSSGRRRERGSSAPFCWTLPWCRARLCHEATEQSGPHELRRGVEQGDHRSNGSGRSVRIGCDADDCCDRGASVETWAHSVDPPEPSEWDRTARGLIVEAVTSWGLAFMTRSDSDWWARSRPGSTSRRGQQLDRAKRARASDLSPSKHLAPCPCTGPCRAGTLRMLLVVLQSVSWSPGICGPVRTLCFAKAPNMEEDW